MVIINNNSASSEKITGSRLSENQWQVAKEIEEKIYNQCSKAEKLVFIAWFDKKYRELQDLNLRGEEWVYYFKIFFSLWEKLPKKEQDTAFRLRVELENHEWPKQPN